MVKVTPAHDPNDYWIGQRHGLPQIKIFDISAMPERRGPGANTGARTGSGPAKMVLEDLEAQGLLVKIEEHRHNVGHCYRCDTVIEPYLSDQWFVKMAPLADPALEVVKNGTIRFYPDRWVKVYEHWMTEHPRLVHLAAALVGAPDPRLVLYKADARRTDAASRSSAEPPEQLPALRRHRSAAG